ncbi:CCA tRNA nucleotidyltransferase [Pullulanibacillus sp. KACC 23026]|uniref:CCA tRNA nucleotidyltransferase n=1 Tax=Pullulanibacillus sp. KACC 23026 TaxID=3028315 RepID=UPI0023AECFE9|nr:CCA tRNA nucleotidyltransferase [Pullulanibacillus sp. KACC 23026]WEG11338.1 CCA tRNA nucleotidyltransferase [Pullulanibacillus sp. KACC 23026]
MTSPFEEATPILDRLIQNGESAYIVGGAVRDSLLKRPIHDIDIATSALPEKVLSLFENTVPVGLKHGTVLVIWGGKPYEVTTYRSEAGYSDYRHPDQVTFEKDIMVDLSRRDFTMNAMAIDRSGKLIDPFNGCKDLLNRQLVTVGEPSKRFEEDPLRMLRACRFVSQLDMTPSNKLVDAMIKKASLIQNISIERVREELSKCLEGLVPHKGFELVEKTHLSQYIPGLEQLSGALDRIKKVNFHGLQSAAERWTLLFYALDREVTADLLLAFKFSRRLTQSILDLSRFFKIYEKTRLTLFTLYHYEEELLYAADRLGQAIGNETRKGQIEALKEQLPIQSRDDLLITGRDLLEWTGLKGGPWVGELLSEIEDEIIKGSLVHSYDAIREWVFEWMKRNKTY